MLPTVIQTPHTAVQVLIFYFKNSLEKFSHTQLGIRGIRGKACCLVGFGGFGGCVYAMDVLHSSLWIRNLKQPTMFINRLTFSLLHNAKNISIHFVPVGVKTSSCYVHSFCILTFKQKTIYIYSVS